MADPQVPDIPTDGWMFKVRYFDTPTETFGQIPFEQVIAPGRPCRDSFRGKVVVVGYTITTAKDRDKHWTPLGEKWGRRDPSPTPSQPS